MSAIAEANRRAQQYVRETLEAPRTVMTADLRAILSCAEAWLEMFPTEDLEPVERESLALVIKAIKEAQR